LDQAPLFVVAADYQQMPARTAAIDRHFPMNRVELSLLAL
jgi:hypothetical protein